MMLSAIGRAIMYAGEGGGRRGKGLGPALLFGLVLFIIGWIGYFFARLIQMAVSRSREYLADASAVQFTRNPQGLAGALKKIGGFEAGAKIDAPYADQAAHFFFGEAIERKFFNLWATHPPLSERIRLLDPHWNGRIDEFSGLAPDGREILEIEKEEAVRRMISPFAVRRVISCTPEQVAASVGAPNPAQVERAATILEAADKTLLEAARSPGGAMALISALLLSGEETHRKNQMIAIQRHGGLKMAEATRRIHSLLGANVRSLRLPLVDISLPALQKLDNVNLNLMLDLIDELVKSDGKVDTFELAVRSIVGARLRKMLGGVTKPPPGDTVFSLSAVLSLLSREGASGEEGSFRSFIAAMEELGPLGKGVERFGEEKATPEEFERSMMRLYARPFSEKRIILKAMVAAAAEDGVISEEESELVRAGAELMGVPVPPLYCTQ